MCIYIYHTLHYITFHYIPWHVMTLHYITLPYIQYSTVQYSTVQYSTVYCSTLQYIAVHCSTFQCLTLHYIQIYIYIHTDMGYDKPTPAKSGDGKLSLKDLSIIQWSSQINDHFGWLNVLDAQWNHIKSQFMTHYKNHFLASCMIKSTAKDVMRSTERTGCSAFECLIAFHYHISPLFVCMYIYIYVQKGTLWRPYFYGVLKKSLKNIFGQYIIKCSLF